jgi:hypothetical protein
LDGPGGCAGLVPEFAVEWVVLVCAAEETEKKIKHRRYRQ